MKDFTREKKHITDWIECNKGSFYELSDAIWSYAELGMEEYRSSKAVTDCLGSNGFKVETGVAGMPTAFVARFGTEEPVIGLSCEYDALPGLSQEKAVNQKSPIIEGAPGHGCGHNLLGPGAVMAAVALKSAMIHFALQGTVKIFGTPAEELCIGKTYMARAGLFNDVDVFIDWHPYMVNSAYYETWNGYFSIRYHFKGRTAHGYHPWFGRSTLDAVVLMGHMIEHLRKHTTPGNPPDAANTINYSFPDVGPAFPVVVPDRSTLWCVGRITTSEELNYVISRVHECAKAAAMATETKVETEIISVTHEAIPNKTVCQVLYNNLQAIGTPEFTEDENNFVKRMQKDLGAPEVGLDSDIMPFREAIAGVSDTAEYSWLAPYGYVNIVALPKGIELHTWQVTATVGTTIGKKAMDVASKVLATSGIDFLMNPEIIVEAKKEWNERLKGRIYRPLIPETAKPLISSRKELSEGEK